MRSRIETIVKELKRLKDEGQTAVYLADDTLPNLISATKPSSASPPPEPSSFASPLQEISPPNSLIKKKPQALMLSPSPSLELPAGDKKTQIAWLRDYVLNCKECNKHVRPGKKVVFGVGSVNADIFFCGEAPGADEEIQGEPFVGRAGQLLTKIIKAMGLKRSDVYIGNIMNWRPETHNMIGNRPPTQEEMNFCLPYLKAQVAVVKPKVIVAMGATAVNGLLGPDPDRRMGLIRGRWFNFEGTDLTPTYHPSYILRNGSLKTKRTIWEDMMQVMERVGLPLSDKQRGYFLTPTT